MRLLRNLAWGLGWSLGLAGMFCALATIIAALDGGRLRFRNFEMTLSEVLLAYLVAGASAGVVIGLFRPYLKSREATWWVAGTVGIIAFGTIGVFAYGPPMSWDSVTIAAVIAIGAASGVALGDHIWKDTRANDKPAA